MNPRRPLPFAPFTLFLPFSLFILSLSTPLLFAAPPDYSLLLNNLDDPDPAIRAQAQEDLMAISRSDLDALRQTAAQSKSISPQQIASLHEIVTQVILADSNASAPADPSKGFVGAHPMQCQIPAPAGQMRPAILIARCVPGYDAYRVLRAGDIILSINGSDVPARDLGTFMNFIQMHAPGEHLQLQILRDGKIDEVSIKLSPRPANADVFNPLDFTNHPEEQVEQYWRSVFLPAIRR